MRGYQLKLKIRRNKTEARMKFFSNRVIPAWNRLPQNIVLSKTTDVFKNQLDKFRATTALSSLFQVTQ